MYAPGRSILRLLTPAALLVGATPEAEAQVVGGVVVDVPLVRHVQVADVLPDSACGVDCARITLQVFANAEWRLRITAAAPQARLAAPEVGGGIRLLSTRDGALELAGPRGGSQLLVVRAVGGGEVPELRFFFVDG